MLGIAPESLNAVDVVSPMLVGKGFTIIFVALIILFFLLSFVGKIFSSVGFFFANLKERIRTNFAISQVRRELKGQPIVTEYKPPENLQPIDLGKMIDNELHVRDLVSVILNLAVRGYLTINYLPKKGWFGRADYEFIKQKSGDDLSHPADKRIFKMLFELGETTKLSSLERPSGAFYNAFIDLRKDLPTYLTSRGLLTESKRKQYYKFSFLIIFALLVIAWFMPFENKATILVVMVFLAIVVLKILGKIFVDRVRFTDNGRQVLAHLFGFRTFLALTEKKRLELTNAPRLEPTVFEQYLPHAIALYVENQWTALFKNISIDLNWYKDQRYTKMNSTLLLLNSLYHFERAMQRTYGKSRPMRGAHRSGLGGGGRVGGGSGGGGGRRW